MSDQLPEFDFAGETYKLACLLPPTFPDKLPKLAAAPTFRTWSRQEIDDAIQNKPVKRREQFSGKAFIINQKSVGSCNAAAATGVLRRAMVLNGRNEVPQLCWEFLYAQINGGVDQGSMLEDGMIALEKIGVPPLDLAKHPINKHIFKNQFDAADYEAARSWTAQACYQVDTKEELATLILSGAGAGVVAVHVGNNFTELNSKGFAGASGGPGNHAVGVDDVAIIDGDLAFDMFNSWDVNYGEGGRAYLDWERHFSQTIKHHGFYAVLAASNPGDGGVPVA